MIILSLIQRKKNRNFKIYLEERLCVITKIVQNFIGFIIFREKKIKIVYNISIKCINRGEKNWDLEKF